MEKTVNDRMYEYYCRRFEKKGRSERIQGRRCVGMEAKFCLTDGRGGAASEVMLQGFFEHLGDKGWTVARDDNLGIATAATREFPSCPAFISTGTGHCKVEFSVPYGRNLRELESYFQAMVEDAKSSTDGEDMRLLCGCISGASDMGDVVAMLEDAGFVDIDITPKDQSREFIQDWQPGKKLEDYVVSANICARRPA